MSNYVRNWWLLASWNIPMYLLKWHLYQAWQTCSLERKIRCNSILNYTYGTSFLFDFVFVWPKKELLLLCKLARTKSFILPYVTDVIFFWKLFSYPLPKTVHVMLLLQNILSKHLRRDLQSWKVERQYNIYQTFNVFNDILIQFPLDNNVLAKSLSVYGMEVNSESGIEFPCSTSHTFHSAGSKKSVPRK